jgi:hypothetical protein
MNKYFYRHYLRVPEETARIANVHDIVDIKIWKEKQGSPPVSYGTITETLNLSN